MPALFYFILFFLAFNTTWPQLMKVPKIFYLNFSQGMKLSLNINLVYDTSKRKRKKKARRSSVLTVNFLSFGDHATLQDIQNRAREAFSNVHCSVVMNLDTLRTEVLHFLFFSFSPFACLMRRVSTLMSSLAHSRIVWREGSANFTNFADGLLPVRWEIFVCCHHKDGELFHFCPVWNLNVRVSFVLFVRENQLRDASVPQGQSNPLHPTRLSLFRKVGQKDMASVPSPVEFDVSPVVGFVPEKEPLVSKVLKTYRK